MAFSCLSPSFARCSWGIGGAGNTEPRAEVSGVSPQVFRRALRRPLTRPGSALEALATGGFGPPFPCDFKPLPLPRHPRGEEEARPAFAGEAGQTGAWPGPDPRSPALRLRPRVAASLSGLDPFPLLLGGSGSRPRPSLLVALSSLFPSPPLTLLRVSDSGAGPVTSNPVWRRRDWPARAIKRATSSFPITHCQSGNRGGPAGNYKLNTPYRLAPLPGASSFRPPTLLCQP